MGLEDITKQPATPFEHKSIIEAHRSYIRIFEDNTFPNLFRRLCFEQQGLETDEVFRLLSFINMFDDTDEETKVHLINLLPTLPALVKQDDDGLWTLAPWLHDLRCRLDLEDGDMDGVVDGKIMRSLQGRVLCGLTAPVMRRSADEHEEDWRELITWISGSMHMLVLWITGEGDVKVGAGMGGLSGISSDI